MNPLTVRKFYQVTATGLILADDQMQPVEACQSCTSSRLQLLQASDYGGFTSGLVGAPLQAGSVPEALEQFYEVGRLTLIICLDCGQIQGSWPAPKTPLEDSTPTYAIPQELLEPLKQNDLGRFGGTDDQGRDIYDLSPEGEAVLTGKHPRTYRDERGNRVNPWDEGWSIEEYNQSVPEEQALHFGRLEHWVLWHVSQGLSTEEIAEALNLPLIEVARVADRQKSLFRPVESLELNVLGRAVTKSLGKPKSPLGGALKQRAKKVLRGMHRTMVSGQFETVAVIADRSGYSTETTRRALIELEEQDFVLADRDEVAYTYALTKAGIKIAGEIFGQGT